MLNKKHYLAFFFFIFPLLSSLDENIYFSSYAWRIDTDFLCSHDECQEGVMFYHCPSVRRA